jgi:hypothetical protein
MVRTDWLCSNWYRQPMLVRNFVAISPFVLAFLFVATGASAWTPKAVGDDPLVRMPGSQHGSITVEIPGDCNCHKGFDTNTEPYFAWQGSMMAQAARDPLFWACLTVAAQDSIWAVGTPNATDICLRCHLPGGWLGGRSDPTNGSSMSGADFDGVHCGICHRMFDPFFETTYDGTREGSDWAGYWDEATSISANGAAATYGADMVASHDITLFNGNDFYDAGNVPVNSGWDENGGGQLFMPVDATRRGPFADATPPHTFYYSRYHKSRYFCSTCHDVTNPVLANLPQAGATPGDGTTLLPTETTPAYALTHVERTFSEFALSAFGQQGGAPGTGAFAPDVFDTSVADNSIARCQDCHLPDTSGVACKNNGVVRPGESTEHPHSGLPFHDLTGANAWISSILASTDSGSSNYDATNETLLSGRAAELTMDLGAGEGVGWEALLAGADRALTGLQRAASLESLQWDGVGQRFSLRVRNHTGHKLISGFPEGRRMWLNVKVYDASDALIWEVNPYDDAASTLKGLPYTYDDPDGILPDPQPLSSTEEHLDEVVYETKPSSSLTGEDHTFHFALADARRKDNRIPPQGFDSAAAGQRKCQPVLDGVDRTDLFTAEEYSGGYDEVELDLSGMALVPARFEVRLLYQVTSREYVEFLRDEIAGTGGTLSGTGAGGDPPYLIQSDAFFDALRAWGPTIWQLWRHNRSLAGAAPVEMASATLTAGGTAAAVAELSAEPVGSAQSFSFTGDLAGVLRDGEQLVLADVSPGTYTSTASIATGWSLTAISCDDGDSTGDVGSATATFHLQAGETTTCTFDVAQDTGACGYPTDVVLASHTVTGSSAWQACTSITAGDGFNIASGGAAVLRAGSRIILRNGFSVSEGGALTVVPDPTLQ